MTKWIFVATLSLAASTASAAKGTCDPAPGLFTTTHHQSPVHADPGDLLFIPGYGFKKDALVAYRLYPEADPSATPAPPASPTAEQGLIESFYDNVPDALAVRLPSVMRKDRTYALRVKNPGGCWSKPFLINDARPLWLTPDFHYATRAPASLPRELKIFGRNLNPAPVDGAGVAATSVRLRGPTTYVLNARIAGAAIDHHEARVSLPAAMSPGTYDVALTRDGKNWVTVPDSPFAVRVDPAPARRFRISDYGCRADDGKDDTACLRKAIDAAAAGGGSVWFTAGRWEVSDPTAIAQSASQGILVPPGVDLLGDGAETTLVAKSARWKEHTLFTLDGRQTVRGIHFLETAADPSNPLPTETTWLRFGRFPWVGAKDRDEVGEILVTDNRFTGMSTAIGAGGRPLHRVIIARNILNAYKNDVLLEGHPTLKTLRFNLRDSVITDNRFLPGRYAEPAIMQGVIAAQIGAARRLDVSDNLIDGRVGDGWRAGFFFHMNNNHEMLSIAGNRAYCTGDKAGDGEAIVFDNNGNDPGFSARQNVSMASATRVGVSGEWREKTPHFYDGYWLQIVGGPGVGQARKIVSAGPGPNPVVTIAPAWDVIPVPNQSTIVVAKAFWNTHIVDNAIDIRPCRKSNANKPQSGFIAWYANTLDSLIDGNASFDANGILVATSYSSELSARLRNEKFNARNWVMLNYANEIRRNTIDGEYNYPRSFGGINLWYGSAPDVASPLLGHGLSISHNVIRRSDAAPPGDVGSARSGAIGFYRSWHASTLTPAQWKATLIFNNVVSDVRTGLYLEPADASLSGAVLYGNRFERVATPVVDNTRPGARIIPAGE